MGSGSRTRGIKDDMSYLVIVNRFTIHDLEKDLLGRGGMGDVYRAIDTQTGELVAVKALSPEIVSRDPDLLERFTREGETLRQLNHPNIVRMVAAVQEDGRHYLVMEYVGGGSLEDLLASQGRLPSKRMVEIALEVADALTRAHHLGIIHRDIKPANVLLAEDGTPRLSDFGIAYVTDIPRLTQTGILVGTVDYLSPEVCQGEPPDERSDIWAFGVMLFEMLAGERPFQGKSLTAKITAILTQPVPDLAGLAPDTPVALANLIYRMLEKDPQQRVQSVRLVGAELEGISKGWQAPTPIRLTPPTSSTPLPSFLEIGKPVDVAAEPQRPVFVTRERELERLDGFLNQALAGQSRVVFVTGDAGQGKTALVQEFAWRAQAAHSNLVVAGGRCNAYTGIGDPYLPFREILGLLTGDVEDLWAARSIGREPARRLWNTLPCAAQALVEAGPDLVDIFVTGAALAKRSAAFGPSAEQKDWLPPLQQLLERKATLPASPDLKQNALFEQYTRVVRAISRQRPLLLILDDLQWADGGSISLLFHLGRSLIGSRLLVLGAYRPTEVALGRGEERHPLEPVVNELKRQLGDIELDLRQTEGENFVAALLDTEPNRLGEAFRRTLFQQTGGHPLATVELLRDMQERGSLVLDGQKHWVEGPTLDWDKLPARVEAMIAERMGRLDEPERKVLQVASVEGETFTAEVVAQVLATGEREIVGQLSSELDRVHHLVSAQGIRQLDGRRLSVYRFRHILFQRYLYNSLDPVERANLHQEVGTALQALYGKEAQEVTVQLAKHFQDAGTSVEAASYLEQAGDRARELYAHQEAVEHYHQAQTAYQRALGDRWKPLQQAELERKIGDALFQKGENQQALEHFRGALTYLGRPLPATRWGARLTIAAELCKQIGHRLTPGRLARPGEKPVSPEVQAEIRLYLALGYVEFLTSPEGLLLDTLKTLNLSETRGSREGLSTGGAAFASIMDFIGFFGLAEGYLQRAVAVAEKSQDLRSLGDVYLCLAAHQSCLGKLDLAYQSTVKAANAYQQAHDRHQQCFMEHIQADYQYYQGKFTQSLETSKNVIQQGYDSGDLQIQCWGQTAHGGALRRLSNFEQGIQALEEAVALADTIPDYGDRIEAGGELGRCYIGQGSLDKALTMLKETKRIYDAHGTAWGNDIAVFFGLAEASLLLAESHSPIEKGHLNEARHACRQAIKHAKTFRPGLPEALRLRGTCEWLKGSPAAAQKCWQDSLALAVEMGTRHDQGMTLYEMGRRLGDREHLERAIAIFAEIGAEFDLARSQEALGKL
jgi:tetratricopeptide (TPR) repeat protein/predicted Ser/Thr protein kinase